MIETYTPRPVSKETERALIKAQLAAAVRDERGANYVPSKKGSA